ncbi:MAG: DUF3800 domain-containing protein [Paracoccus hibiscisoli]|uniref:DUF3800 domain-containing protein n=1 Tax=Paracoccus hibiscisoli TaxID=2023261 RepID=UPI00391CADC5
MSADRKKIYYFCDETSHTAGDPFLAVGGIAINSAALAEIEAEIASIRSKYSISGEIKWSNTKNRRDSGQKAYADLLRHLVDKERLHFHVRFQETAEYNHRLSGSRLKIDTVSKAHYQLLLHRPVEFYGKTCDLHIRPDNGNCTELLGKFVDKLNSGAKKKHKIEVGCIRSLHPTDSAKSHFLQLLDVTLGAFASVRNGRAYQQPEVSPKVQLASHILNIWDNPNLHVSTDKEARRFNIWNVVPKYGKGIVTKG